MFILINTIGCVMNIVNDVEENTPVSVNKVIDERRLSEAKYGYDATHRQMRTTVAAAECCW